MIEEKNVSLEEDLGKDFAGKELTPGRLKRLNSIIKATFLNFHALDLAFSSLSDKDLAFLKDALIENKNIKYINLDNTHITSAAFPLIMELVQKKPNFIIITFPERIASNSNIVLNEFYRGDNFLLNLANLKNIQDDFERQTITQFLTPHLLNEGEYASEVNPINQLLFEMKTWFEDALIIFSYGILAAPTIVGPLLAIMYCAGRQAEKEANKGTNELWLAGIQNKLDKIKNELVINIDMANAEAVITLLTLNRLRYPAILMALSEKKEALFSVFFDMLEKFSVEKKLFFIECALDKGNALNQVFSYHRSTTGQYVFGFFQHTHTMKKLLSIKEDLLAQHQKREQSLSESSFEILVDSDNNNVSDSNTKESNPEKTLSMEP